MPDSSTVIIARDSQWPHQPGICCWRASIRDAVAQLDGIRVAEIDIRTIPAGQGSSLARRSGSHLTWLRGRARRAAAWVVRRTQKVRRLGPTAAHAVRARIGRSANKQLLSVVGDRSVIIAESHGVIEELLALKIAPRRIWMLAMPYRRLDGDMPQHGWEHVRTLAPKIGGFITDSEIGRDSVERAADNTRPNVIVFPPIAVDRPCSECGSLEVESALWSAENVSLQSWREVIEQASDDQIWLLRQRGVDVTDWQLSSNALTLLGADWRIETRLLTRGEQERAAQSLLASSVTREVESASPTQVVISGFDLKFIRKLGDDLGRSADLAVTLDEWRGLGRESARTTKLVRAADTIVGEWVRPSAIRFAQLKRPEQRLIVRLHRYELDTWYPRKLDISRVDAVVFVSPPIRQRIEDELCWPPEKLVYIPNYLDVEWLDRPKLPGARFAIGMVGIVHANKRFDLALDILAAVRRQDPRFHLRVRSVLPWQDRYAWDRQREREYFGLCLDRIEQDPLLRGAVLFDHPGQDMARWYRQIGHVVSTSDVESFHMAIAEGMASGAVPVIRPWPGASEIYESEWVKGSVQAAADAILEGGDEGSWSQRAVRAKDQIRQLADPKRTVHAWSLLLHGEIDEARSLIGCG